MNKIITFLGTGNYEPTTYSYTDKQMGIDCKVTTRFIQEAIHEIVGSDSIMYVALTKSASERNWLDNGDRKGLKSILDSKGIKYKEIQLADGKNEDEMWSNFDAIYEALEEGDNVYIDVTHSFRSIPIIVMSVLNYAKFIKKINIKAIYYGAYEARENNIAPIFDLSLFSTITDWTIGAEKFISTGDSRQLSRMVKETASPILRETKGRNEEVKLFNKVNSYLEDFSSAIYTVRGNKISEYGCKLKQSLEPLNEIDENKLKPFEKILDEIHGKVHFYSGDIVNDVFNTAKLCRDLNLIQQGYTFLLENIINYVCEAGKLDFRDITTREDVSTVLAYYSDRWSHKLDSKLEDLNNKIKGYINREIANLFIDLGDYRNDLNHAGYRQNARRVNKIRDDLDKYINEFERLIIKPNCY